MGSFLVIDDHSLVRDGLGRLLGVEFPGAFVECVATRREALAAVQERFHLLAVADISLPGGSGLDLIRELKNLSPKTRVLIHTMHPEDQFGVRAIRLGADGFITKDAPVAQVMQAARKILRGGRYLSPALAEMVAGALAAGTEAGMDSLSDREFQILRSIAAGQTLTEIAGELRISIKTVSTYRSRILEKLDVRTTAGLIRYALEHQLGPSEGPR